MATNGTWPRLENLADTSGIEGLLPALVLAVALVVGLFSTFQHENRKLSHIPILGAELGTKGRKKEFRFNAKSFLQRGYEEVSRDAVPSLTVLNWLHQFNKASKAFQIQITEGCRNCSYTSFTRGLPLLTRPHGCPQCKTKRRSWFNA